MQPQQPEIPTPRAGRGCCLSESEPKSYSRRSTRNGGISLADQASNLSVATVLQESPMEQIAARYVRIFPGSFIFFDFNRLTVPLSSIFKAEFWHQLCQRGTVLQHFLRQLLPHRQRLVEPREGKIRWVKHLLDALLGQFSAKPMKSI